MADGKARSPYVASAVSPSVYAPSVGVASVATTSAASAVPSAPSAIPHASSSTVTQLSTSDHLILQTLLPRVCNLFDAFSASATGDGYRSSRRKRYGQCGACGDNDSDAESSAPARLVADLQIHWCTELPNQKTQPQSWLSSATSPAAAAGTATKVSAVATSGGTDAGTLDVKSADVPKWRTEHISFPAVGTLSQLQEVLTRTSRVITMLTGYYKETFQWSKRDVIAYDDPSTILTANSALVRPTAMSTTSVDSNGMPTYDRHLFVWPSRTWDDHSEEEMRNWMIARHLYVSAARQPLLHRQTENVVATAAAAAGSVDDARHTCTDPTHHAHQEAPHVDKSVPSVDDDAAPLPVTDDAVQTQTEQIATDDAEEPLQIAAVNGERTASRSDSPNRRARRAQK